MGTAQEAMNKALEWGRTTRERLVGNMVQMITASNEEGLTTLSYRCACILERENQEARRRIFLQVWIRFPLLISIMI